MSKTMATNREILEEIGSRIEAFRCWFELKQKIKVNSNISKDWKLTIQTLVIYLRQVTNTMGLKVYNNLAPIDMKNPMLRDFKFFKQEITKNKEERLPITTVTIQLQNEDHQPDFIVDIQLQFSVIEKNDQKELNLVLFNIFPGFKRWAPEDKEKTSQKKEELDV